MGLRSAPKRLGGVSFMVIGLVVAVFAASCGGSTSSPPAAVKPASLLFVNPLPKYPAWREIGDCVAQQAQTLGIKETESGPTTGTLDANIMVQQIQQGIANKVGAVVTFPATDQFIPVLQQARKAGIYVGTLYGGAGTEAAANVNVGADFAQSGQLFLQAIADRSGPQKVGLITQGPSGAAKAWSDAFNAAAKKTSNVTVVAEVYTGDDASKALDAAVNLMTAHPEINAIASHQGTATQGTIAAIKSKGKVGQVVFVGNGTAGGGFEGLTDGTVYRVQVQDLCGAGKAIVSALSDVANGKQVAASIPVGIKLVDKDNVKQYTDQGWQ